MVGPWFLVDRAGSPFDTGILATAEKNWVSSVFVFLFWVPSAPIDSFELLGLFSRTSGFLAEDLTDVIGSADDAVKNTADKIKNEKISVSKVKTAIFHLNIITDVIYLNDPTQWDENKDGVFFQWGGDFSGFYLNYQIQRMSVPKIDILDRLCSFECGIFSSAWKLPEGLIFRLVSQSFSSWFYFENFWLF